MNSIAATAHNLTIALAFCAMVLGPCMAAMFSTRDVDAEN